MNLKHALFGIATAAALIGGMVSSAVAQQEATQAVLADGTGVLCGLTINGGLPIDFGTYTYNGADYLKSDSRVATVDFSVGILSDLHPTDCSVVVHGADLVGAGGSIPVGRIALADNGGPVVTSAVSPLTTADQAFINTVPGPPLGTGTANVTATFTLDEADDILPPGTYTGSITLTSTPSAP